MFRISFECNIIVTICTFQIKSKDLYPQISFFVGDLHPHIKLSSNIEIILAYIAAQRHRQHVTNNHKLIFPPTSFDKQLGVEIFGNILEQDLPLRHRLLILQESTKKIRVNSDLSSYLYYKFINILMEKTQMEHEVIYNSFRDEVLHKEMQIDKIQYEFNNKISGNRNDTYKHSANFVKFCRKIIQEFDRIYGDMRSYFVELKLDFVYQNIYRTFKILVQSFKTLSQLLLNNLKVSKTDAAVVKSQLQSQAIQLSDEAKRKQFKKKNLKEMEHLDFLLKNIEEEESQIAKEKAEAEKYFQNKKKSLENTGPSEAIPQLEELKRNIDRIVENSERMFDQNYLYRHQELRNRVIAIKSPEELDQILRKQIFGNMKTHLSKALTSALMTLSKIVKARERSNQLLQQSLKKQRFKQQGMQTVPFEFKIGQMKKNQKQLENFFIEFEIMKRENAKASKELFYANNRLAQLQHENKQLTKQLETTENHLRKKALELHQQKVDFEWNLNRKDQTIQLLNQKMRQSKEIITKQQINEIGVQCICDEHVDQHPQIVEEMINQSETEQLRDLELKSISKMSSHRKTEKLQGMYLERELKEKKKQNSLMRRSLTVIIKKLNEEQLIIDYPLSELDDDIKTHALIQKIEKMRFQISEKLKGIIDKDVERKLQEKKSVTNQSTQTSNSLEKPVKLNKPRVSIERMSQDRSKHPKKSTRIILNVPESRSELGNSHKNYSRTDLQKSSNHLERLKKQLVERVESSRKVSAAHRLKSSRLMQEPKQSNISVSNDENANPRKTQKRSNFYPKDISFEQLNLSKGNGIDGILTVKRNDNALHNTADMGSNVVVKNPTRKYIQNQAPFFSAENISNWTDASKLIQYIEQKNDKKDMFFRNFVRSLMMEIRKRKGDKFLRDVSGNVNRSSALLTIPKQIIFEGQSPTQYASTRMKNSLHKKK